MLILRLEQKMTGWDILNEIMKNLPPIAAMLFLLAAGIIFAIGFFRHGVNFIKYGFKQTVLDSSLEKRFDRLEAKIEAIEVNHFGHLKNFLSELTSILLDKNIINNTEKTRLAPQPSPQGEGSPLDNQLRDM